MSYTIESITAQLQDDDKVKLAGIDADGMLRGKIISKKKFLSVLSSGFGFCSIVFGWDMHDRTYFQELSVSNAANGYRDILAKIDINTFRRIPWEQNAVNGRGIPFFLVSFHDPETQEPIAPCPRNLLASIVSKLQTSFGWKAMVGVEYEFYNFKETSKSLQGNKGQGLEHLTPGMFGYSVTRPTQNQEFYYGVFDACKKFNVDLEGWHTESGPGVYEAALEYGEVSSMADRASLFKYTVKSLGASHGITPCFMSKPVEGLPGNSGHMHISLVDSTGTNLFARAEKNPNPTFADLAHVSDIGEYFLAGILDGLPSIMPLLAPTINSYKRLVENFWAPVTVSWGLEHRAASIRLIAPPTASPKATRFEIRTPGADANPHYVFAAVLGCGFRGIEKKLKLTIPPLGKGEETGDGERLAKNLGAAVDKMVEKGSVAREVLGDVFVDHYAGTRRHELRLWEQAVTDWEVRRYIETV
ncbi:hypothetical protein FN846DRAFT_983919 [Sphaerosporella brunnea]|uniref:Glutamine synthetase n=1 Tax=Sphaerosporella brunnea TaxID=1250544 RepID=A0A5J5EW39_9PEZI|nr:hypothetical protein FN846DRAFT_983919 [Sphaerosporella brunnea]